MLAENALTENLVDGPLCLPDSPKGAEESQSVEF